MNRYHIMFEFPLEEKKRSFTVEARNKNQALINFHLSLTGERAVRVFDQIPIMHTFDLLGEVPRG